MRVSRLLLAGIAPFQISSLKTPFNSRPWNKQVAFVLLSSNTKQHSSTSTSSVRSLFISNSSGTKDKMNDDLRQSSRITDEPQRDRNTMAPPPMSVWNGALRFSLEVAAIVSIGFYGHSIGPTKWSRPLLSVVLPTAAAATWGIFNVPNDPSRSGGAPVVVSGKGRLTVEAAILGFGAYAMGSVWHPAAAGVYAGATVLHYVSYRERIRWLLKQKR
jgi:hypothetical protein